MRTAGGVVPEVQLDEVPRARKGLVLTEQVRTAITSGALPAGTPLAASRVVAAELAVSRGVVVRAFEQLSAEGFLESRPGSGTRVAATSAGTERPASALDVARVAGDNPGLPDPELFPRHDWSAAHQRVVARLGNSDLLYGDPRGLDALRTSLADYLRRTRGISADPECIVVVNGVAQALAMISLLLSRTGRHPTIAVEDPGSAGTCAQLRWWGARLAPVPVDDAGLDVDALRRAHARRAVDAVAVTPAHQYPTGVVLAADRRSELAAFAAHHDALVIEDDYDADYRYDRRPISSIRDLAPDHVIAVGSVSKSMGPGVRLGWMVAPRRLVADFADIRSNIDLCAPVITQAVLSELIDAGALDRHIRRTRAEYRRRSSTLLGELARTFPDAHVPGVPAGLHVAVDLPPRLTERPTVEAARTAGFVAQPMSRYRHRPGAPGIVLGFAHLPPPAIERAGRVMSQVLVSER